MLPKELILISDDESDESVVEIPQNKSASATKNDSNKANANVKSSVVINSFSAKKEEIELVNNNRLVVNDDDDDYYFLMQELTDVINSCQSNLVEQNSCPNAADSYIVPEISDESVAGNNQKNDITTDGNPIKILNVESLNDRINQWMNCQDQFLPPADEVQEEFEGNFRNIEANNNQHEDLNSKFLQPSEFLELTHGSSQNNVPSKNDPWMKTQINRLELSVLNKYLPVVRLSRLSLQSSDTNLNGSTKDQSEIDNSNNYANDNDNENNNYNDNYNEHDMKSFINKNIVESNQEIGRVLSNIKNENPGIFEYSCEICVKTFTSEDLFQKHLKYHHTDKLYKCNDCDFTSNLYKPLLAHRWTHTSIRPYRCLQCNYGTSIKQHLYGHIRRIHTTERPFVCSYSSCDFATKNSQYLKQHIQKKHTAKEYYKCETCGFETVSLSRLNNHRCRSQPRYACSECDHYSSDVRNLKAHMASHSTRKLIQCEHCNFSTPYKYAFKNHRTRHQDVDLKCEVCYAKLINLDKMKAHKLKYHSLFPSNQIARCFFCEETFTNKFNMRQHIRVHQSKNWHKCSECVYTTSSEKQFQKHLDDHKFNKLFTCYDCSKAFVHKKMLKLHRFTFHDTISQF